MRYIITTNYVVAIILLINFVPCLSMNNEEKKTYRHVVEEMFEHAYGAYKEHAFPADELMPLSCRGRYRGSEVDRGDIDESLGNFSLTLIDTLDTLAVLGKVEEFEKQVKYVVANVSFNADAVVSLFETNIRVLGGLLGAHSMAVALKQSEKGMLWYQDDLLPKAIDLADRLLSAFNTSTGIPYPKINLRYGVNNPKSRVGHETDTCTACAGTMIMEFGALSRLTGKPIYEEKAHKAMEALWKYRSYHSDLLGTTINIHNGHWTRRDSGVGAGIDSYYEYCLKAYILLGDDSYIEKFNRHYSAIKRYMRHGFMFIDVMMHQPEQQVRSHVDSLQAFWPGLQVLKGDLKPAIEMHELLYNVAKKYKFLPEAFTTNFDVHWGQHPLRPEFVESTYFLYQATKDPYYLDVGKHVIEALEEYARVPCGYAALKDLRTLSHEDKMDSFFLAETFKYLYLLFSEESEHLVDINDYIFTTEAHLLPLSLSLMPVKKDNNETEHEKKPLVMDNDDDQQSCPRPMYESNAELRSFAELTRQRVADTLNKKKPKKVSKPACQKPPAQDFASMVHKTAEKVLLQFNSKRPRKLRAEEFQMANEKHLTILKDLGISLSKESNGKVQLVHQAVLASSPEDAEEGIKFMQEMVQLAKQKGELQTRVVQILSPPFNGKTTLPAGSAQFGADLGLNEMGVSGETTMAIPFNACQFVKNGDEFANRIVIIQRGECMFIDKVRLAQRLGALGVIIIDHTEGTSAETSQPFGMSGDSNPGDVFIPSVFLFRKEGDLLSQHIKEQGGHIEVRLGAKAFSKSIEPENIKILEDSAHGIRKEPEHPAKDTNENNSQETAPRDVQGTNPDQPFVTQEKPPGKLLLSKRNEVVNADGSKVITTTSSYIGPNENGEIKEHIQTLIQTCPTLACDKDVSYKMSTIEKSAPSQEEEGNGTKSPINEGEKREKHMENYEDLENAKEFKILKDSLSTASNPSVEDNNDDNLDIDAIVSENLKETISKLGKESVDEGDLEAQLKTLTDVDNMLKTVNMKILKTHTSQELDIKLNEKGVDFEKDAAKFVEEFFDIDIGKGSLNAEGNKGGTVASNSNIDKQDETLHNSDSEPKKRTKTEL